MRTFLINFSEYNPSIDELYRKEIQFEGKKLLLEFHDIGGQEEYETQKC
jgi:hypothetical protein